MRYKERHWRVNSNPETVQHRDERKAAIEWARTLLTHPNLAILDTETTGLLMASFFDSAQSVTQWAGAEVCEIAAIDGQGNPLVNTLVQIQEPEGMDPDAYEIHGISPLALSAPEVPAFPEVWQQFIRPILTDRIIVGYNIIFDLKIIQQTARRYEGLIFPHDTMRQSHDLQRQFTQFRGVPPNEYEIIQGEKLHRFSLEKAAQYFGIPLPPIRHRALDDCRLTLAVLQKLAQEKA